MALSARRLLAGCTSCSAFGMSKKPPSLHSTMIRWLNPASKPILYLHEYCDI